MKTLLHRLCLTAASAVLLWATGCSTVVLVDTKREPGAPSYPPTNRHTVQVLSTQPVAPHVKLGEITLKPSGSLSTQDLDKKLQREAAKMGASAVVILSDRMERMTGPGEIVFPGERNEPGMARVILAEAVRYTTDH